MVETLVEASVRRRRWLTILGLPKVPLSLATTQFPAGAPSARLKSSVKQTSGLQAGVEVISIKVPKFVVPAVTPVIVAVPVLVILPLANGVLVVGRTRMFFQVSEFCTPPKEVAVTVNCSVVAVMAVIATEVPDATPLIFLLSFPLPAVRVINTVGAIPPVSNANPVGTLRMMVPIATSAGPASV